MLAAAPRAGEAAEAGEANTVVLVEADDAVRAGLVDLLTDSGFAVVAAVGSVRQGRACIESYRPAFAVVDRLLPDGSGLDLCRLPAEPAERVAVLVHSASWAVGEEQEALDAGAVAAILKSIRGDTLIETLRCGAAELLRRSERERSSAAWSRRPPSR